MKLQLPTELAAVLGELGKPTLSDAPTAPPITVYVSYIAPHRCFVARREGLPEVCAGSISELMTRLTEQWPGTEFSLHLSRVARAEIKRRKNGGGPMPEMWY